MRIHFQTLVCIIFILILAGAPAAFADSITTVNFTDNHNYWLQGEAGNWASGVTSYGWNRDATDNIGTPNFLNGSITLDGNYLSSITVNYTNGSSVETIGDLFLDINGDHYWDYVVKLYNTPGQGAAGSYALYSANLDSRKGDDASNNSRYYMTGSSNSGAWAGYLIRDNSPFAAKEDQLGAVAGSVGFSGWQTAYGPNSSTFVFGAHDIYVGDGSLTLAWDPNCANDVLYEQVQTPRSVPEPPTGVLLLSVLVGFVAFDYLRRSL